MSEYRKTVDSFLAEISAAVGKNIRLNDQGICAFTYEQLTIVIEVPESVGSFFIYTSLSNLNQANNPSGLMEKCLRLNYLQQETRGGCLSLDPINNEVMFSYTDRVTEINSTDFRNILENFIDTSLNLFGELDKIGMESGDSSDSGDDKSSGNQDKQPDLPPELMNQSHHFIP